MRLRRPGRRPVGPARTLLLATRVDHTAAPCAPSARAAGHRCGCRAPGCWSSAAPTSAAFLAQALGELSAVEAAEVRCLAAGPRGAGGQTTRCSAAAMLAPTLAAAGAPGLAPRLLPLFEDEQACFHSVYQPIVRPGGRRDGRPRGPAARPCCPTARPVMPDELFPAAEAAGWTNLLDRVGRTTALRGAGGWLGDDLLFINFVPTSIYRPEVCLRTTEQAAEQAGVRLDQLVFEVTEGHRVHDLDHLERVFAYYRSRGCLVALDDLGAG